MKEYYFNSADKKTKIHCASWNVTDSPKGVLLIVHGMCEYVLRYERFARFMAENGYFVAIHDHLGHGESVVGPDEYGFFGVPLGNEYLLSDIKTHIDLIKKEYPAQPVFVLGHSMGSFLVRQYICDESENLTGAVIMGTGVQSRFNLVFGDLFTKLLSKIYGWHHRSKLIQFIAFGSYLKKIKHPKTSRDWLTKDESIVRGFIESNITNFIFTLDGFNNMFKSISRAQNPENIKRIREDFPIFIVSGTEDPVGGYGKGVVKVKELLSRQCRNIKFKLYNGDRHEILNEIDYMDVQKDLLNWFDEIVGVGND